MGVVLWLNFSGVMEIVDFFLDISWHVYVQYAVLVVPVHYNATVKAPYLILCYLIFFLGYIYEVLGILSYMVSDSKVFYH